MVAADRHHHAQVRPLGPENDLAFKLVNLLDVKQRAQAIRAAKPRNLALGPKQDGKTIPPDATVYDALAMMAERAWIDVFFVHPAQPADGPLTRRERMASS